MNQSSLVTGADAENTDLQMFPAAVTAAESALSGVRRVHTHTHTTRPKQSLSVNMTLYVHKNR